MTPVWLTLSLLFSALLLGTTFAHVLEIRAKARMDGSLWTTLQHRLYRASATVGGVVEMGAILAPACLAWSVRDAGGPFRLGAGALTCFALAFFAVWLGMVLPVNREVARWNPAAVPPGWEHWRRRWDTGHAVRFALHMLGFGLLVGLAVFQGS